MVWDFSVKAPWILPSITVFCRRGRPQNHQTVRILFREVVEWRPVAASNSLGFVAYETLTPHLTAATAPGLIADAIADMG